MKWYFDMKNDLVFIQYIYYIYSVLIEFRIFLICEQIKYKMWVKNFLGVVILG